MIKPIIVLGKNLRFGKKAPYGPGLTPGHPLGLALSGGGHRASLFGLGVLMAMHDAGRLPEQISSVSGGSITNAVLAYKYFAKRSNEMGGNEALWEHETRQLFETIVNKGTLTKTWVRFLMVFLILPPVGFVVMALLDMLPPWQITIPLAIAWATLSILRGLLIEWLISKRYFGDIFKRVNLEALSHSNIEHVICCTDLVTGRPLYISTRKNGQIFRRFLDRPIGVGPRTITPEKASREIKNMGVSYSAPNQSIASAVRASAGFPGIPPRRLQMKKFMQCTPENCSATDFSSLAFLSDGGIWNNLATQPFEDGYLWDIHGPWVVVVADASALLDYEKPNIFHIPGIAEILALIRQAVIQNINTVGPRRMGYQDWIRREMATRQSARFTSERLYPVVSCIETPKDVKTRLASALNDTYSDTFLDQDRIKYMEEVRSSTRKRVESLERSAQDSQSPTGDIPIDPNAKQNYHRLSYLAMTNGTTGEVGKLDPVSNCPTTLGKIDRKTAIAIVGRGYANTAITLYLTGLGDKLVFPRGWLGHGEA